MLSTAMPSTTSLRASLRAASTVYPRPLQSRLLTASSRSREAKTSTEGQAATQASRNEPKNERSPSDQVRPSSGRCRLETPAQPHPPNRTPRQATARLRRNRLASFVLRQIRRQIISANSKNGSEAERRPRSERWWMGNRRDWQRMVRFRRLY